MRERLAADVRLIEERLRTLVPERSRLTEAMRYSLLAGGKRLRPVLTLEFARACGGSDAAAMDAACAVELLHTYSLIHDDLPAMDDDALRRGKPTNHVVYGEWLAILAGDALQAEAFGTILRAPVPDRVRAEAARLLAEAAGAQGICEGQFLDMDGEGRALGAEEITAINAGKTAALLSAACMIGCVCAGSEERLPHARAYGQSLGLAFQLRDDLLDLESTTEELGKPVGSDVRNGKTTMASLLGAEACRRRITEETAAAVSVLREHFGAPRFLVWLTERLAGREN